MQTSTSKNKRALALSILSALLLWQGAALLLAQELILPSPAKVLMRLFDILTTPANYPAMANSLSRILLGIGAAFFSGSVLAFLANRFRFLKSAFFPYMLVIKSVPVASFIVLFLLWLPNRALGSFIAFLMALPIVYNNVSEGLKSVDSKLLQMAKSFSVPFIRRAKAIYLPGISASLVSALSSSVGLGIKAGIAAELIAAARGSIGYMLYDAKVYILTVDLFAWTLIIILLSLIIEKAAIALLSFALKGAIH